MTSREDDNDGRSLWWMIPSAIAGVLGIAGATILRQRQRREERGTVGRETPSATPPPLAGLPDDPPDTAPEHSARQCGGSSPSRP